LACASICFVLSPTINLSKGGISGEIDKNKSYKGYRVRQPPKNATQSERARAQKRVHVACFSFLVIKTKNDQGTMPHPTQSPSKIVVPAGLGSYKNMTSTQNCLYCTGHFCLVNTQILRSCLGI
jgi:hypothetical protein